MDIIGYLKGFLPKTSEEYGREILAGLGVRTPTHDLFVEQPGREDCRHTWSEIPTPDGQTGFIPDGPGGWYATYLYWHECDQCGEIRRQETHALI